MIQFKNISKDYVLKGQRVHALDQINLEIPLGSIFGIIGYSGAGKSTLIRLINLLERPTQGQVIIQGKDFTALDAAALRHERSNIGMIFQHFNLLESKTVAENIAMPLKLLGVNAAERDQRVDELLDYVGLNQKKQAYPDELSGGQKQLIAFARVLVKNPSVLILDESTSAMDRDLEMFVMDLLSRLKRDKIILFISHRLHILKKYADYIYLIENGRVSHYGTHEEMMEGENMYADYWRAFM